MAPSVLQTGGACCGTFFPGPHVAVRLPERRDLTFCFKV